MEITFVQDEEKDLIDQPDNDIRNNKELCERRDKVTIDHNTKASLIMSKIENCFHKLFELTDNEIVIIENDIKASELAIFKS